MRRLARHRAFTLLETLLALTTLAALTALIAALLGQMRLWAGDREPAQRALQPAQLESLMREQLRERVLAGADNAGGGAGQARARMEADALIFYTSASALLKGAPVVRAAYTIEREERSLLVGAQTEPRAALVLTERRVLDVQHPDAGVQEASASLRERDLERRLPLLEDCAALALETPVARESSERAVGEAREQAEPTFEWVSFAAHLAAQAQDRSEAGIAERAGADASAPPSAPAPGVFRLRGECEDRESIWVFTGGASLSY